MQYNVEVEEILKRIITIEANSEEEAIDIVKDKYRACDIVLDYSDFVGEPTIRCIGQTQKERE